MFGYNRLFRNPAQAYTLLTVLWSQDVAQNLTTRLFKLEKGCVCFFSYFCSESYSTGSPQKSENIHTFRVNHTTWQLEQNNSTQLKIVMEWTRYRHQVPSYRSIFHFDTDNSDADIRIRTTLIFQFLSIKSNSNSNRNGVVIRCPHISQSYALPPFW